MARECFMRENKECTMRSSRTKPTKMKNGPPIIPLRVNKWINSDLRDKKIFKRLWSGSICSEKYRNITGAVVFDDLGVRWINESGAPNRSI